MAHAYCKHKGKPAELVSANNAKIVELVSRDFGIGMGPGLLNEWSTPEKNRHAVYPAVLTGEEPDEWHVRDPENDVISYQAADGGEAYHVDQAWREMIYDEAQAHAGIVLRDYYYRHDTSPFTVGERTYPATVPATVSYFKIRDYVADNQEPYGRYVFDVDGAVEVINTKAEWAAFWEAFEQLSHEANTTVGQAWQAILAVDPDAPDATDQVRRIIDGLDQTHRRV